MLLLDQNLSPHLVRRLADTFPHCEHVARVGLATAEDREVWKYADSNELTVVTKDSDFNDLAMLSGPPPHVVWIQRGNCSTTDIESLLREHSDTIASLMGTETAVLILV